MDDLQCAVKLVQLDRTGIVLVDFHEYLLDGVQLHRVPEVPQQVAELPHADGAGLVVVQELELLAQHLLALGVEPMVDYAEFEVGEVHAIGRVGPELLEGALDHFPVGVRKRKSLQRPVDTVLRQEILVVNEGEVGVPDALVAEQFQNFLFVSGVLGALGLRLVGHAQVAVLLRVRRAARRAPRLRRPELVPPERRLPALALVALGALQVQGLVPVRRYL
mmetsp:Transcript_14723/g.42141  ORF Transcript_14723/g.42141 Transcript_14723/m.42141 type:complete len:220 (-) Transcript_14723:500-1159(-)